MESFTIPFRERNPLLFHSEIYIYIYISKDSNNSNNSNNGNNSNGCNILYYVLHYKAAMLAEQNGNSEQ